MMNVREEIRSWLTEILDTTEVSEHGSVSIISLMHTDGYGREVDIYNVKSNAPKFGNPDALADVLFRIADRHARGLPGAQQFKLQAMYGSENTPLRYMPFGMTGALQFGSLPNGGLATESPTATGQTQQAMRLTELHVQGSYADRQHVSNMQHQIIEGLRTENLAVKKEAAELWIACKDLLLDLYKQRHDTRMSELAAARAAEFQRQVMALAPALINMMSGRDIFPAALAENSLLDGLAAGTTPEQMRAFAGIIATQVQNGDKLSAVVMDHYNKYHEKMARIAAEEKRLLKSAPGDYEAGERDAAGEALKALRGSRPEEEKGLPSPKVGLLKAVETAIDNGVVKAVQATPAQNGHAQDAQAQGEPSPALAGQPIHRDTTILERLFTQVPEGMLGALTSTLAANDPELAQMITERYAESKKPAGG